LFVGHLGLLKVLEGGLVGLVSPMGVGMEWILVTGAGFLNRSGAVSRVG
jgi:hypothetical protein